VRMEQSIGRYRMRLIGMVGSAPSVREGCRRAGIHPSTYYDWLRLMDREGVDGLTPRPGRTRLLSPERIRLEAEVVAFGLANPPWGPGRLFYELQRRGVPVGSASQVWRILRAHDLNTRRHRYRLIAATRGLAQADLIRPTPRRSQPRVGRLEAEQPGDLVQLDCFHLGTMKEARLGVHKTPGVVWQYTAIDVASSFTWAQLHTSAHNPSAVHTTALALRVADDLARWGWTWKQASTDRGNEFVDHRFGDTLRQLGVKHRLIPPGRPQSNGKVEQVQDTVLEECWKPAFVGYTHPTISGLRQDLHDYLNDYNWQRPHQGRWNKGQPPGNIINPNSQNHP
jgi:transposase InsO family protein